VEREQTGPSRLLSPSLLYPVEPSRLHCIQLEGLRRTSGLDGVTDKYRQSLVSIRWRAFDETAGGRGPTLAKVLCVSVSAALRWPPLKRTNNMQNVSIEDGTDQLKCSIRSVFCACQCPAHCFVEGLPTDSYKTLRVLASVGHPVQPAVSSKALQLIGTT